MHRILVPLVSRIEYVYFAAGSPSIIEAADCVARAIYYRGDRSSASVLATRMLPESNEFKRRFL